MMHMPFLTRDETGQPLLFYCESNEEPQSGSRAWKIKCSHSTDRLGDLIPNATVECSPSAWYDGSWNLTFIAANDGKYWLYRAFGPKLSSLCQPRQIVRTKAGFVNSNYLVYGVDDNTLTVRSSEQFTLILSATIYRVTYRADAPHIILITGMASDVFTVEYNLLTGEQNYIVCDGKPTYKCTVFGDHVLYADTTGGGFEDRRIVKAEKFERVPTNCLVKGKA